MDPKDRENRYVPVKLTDAEYDVRAQQLAQAVKNGQVLETEKKNAANAFKEKIESNDADIVRLSSIVKDRAEHRDVECYWEANWSRNSMELVRTDTGEVIDQRAMTSEERQRSLFPGRVVSIESPEKKPGA